MWKIIGGLVIVAAVGVGIRQIWFKPKPVYETVAAERKDLVQTLEVSGEIAAERKVTLRFQTGGKLAWVGVKEGDWVKQWAAVASLDKSILKKNLAKFLNDYMHQRWDFDQIRENNLVTSDNYDEYSFSNTVERLIEQEQFLLNKTVLDVEIQDLTNKLATLVAPMAGVVTRVDAPVAGVNVTAADAIEIVDPASLYFEAEVDEADITKVAVGQAAEIKLEAGEDKPIEAQVTWIDFAASTSDGGGKVFLVRLKLVNPDQLRLGMTGEAAIRLNSKEGVVAIPRAAVIEKEGQNWIKLKQGGKIIDKPVTVGLETDEEMEITAGLAAGDEVIVGGDKTRGRN
jgi:RND family efflux transporter MFP subunit